MIDDIFLFIKVAIAGSFTDAARVYGIHASTISRRLRALETSLHVKLFNLNRRNCLELTTAGENLKEQFWSVFQYSEDVLADFNSLTEVAGNLTIVLADSMRDYIITDKFAALLAKYPKLRINLTNSYFTPTGHEVNFDIGLTTIVPGRANYVRQKVQMVEAQLFASDKYLQINGCPMSVSDLPGKHKLIGLTRLFDNTIITDFCLYHKYDQQQHHIQLERQNISVSCDTFETAISLAQQGLGIVAILPELAVGRNLVPILPEYIASAQINLFLVQSNNVKTKAKEVVLKFIKESLGL